MQSLRPVGWRTHTWGATIRDTDAGTPKQASRPRALIGIDAYDATGRFSRGALEQGPYAAAWGSAATGLLNWTISTCVFIGSFVPAAHMASFPFS